MNKEYTNNAVVRDPCTIFIYWNAQAIINKNFTEKKSDLVRAILYWIVQITNLTTGQTDTIRVDPADGKLYLHSLTPGTYYNIRLCQIDSLHDVHTYFNFGTLHTPDNAISNISDSDSKWQISMEDFLRLHGTALPYIGSS